ncbi:MAG: ATP synthase F1 subunit delta [Chlamydiales bacterium]|nr:ATP synthase F1 subunit delta [Chlamydiales bacterium]
MIGPRVGRQYAKALFNTAEDDEQLRTTLSDLRAFTVALKCTPGFLQFLRNPQLTVKQKEQVVFDTLGKKANPALCALMTLLLERGRIQYVPELTKAFAVLVNERLGVLEVRLITANPVSSGVKDALAKKLEQSYGKKIEFIERIDPKMMGGVRLMIGTQMVDSSIRAKLFRIKESMLAARV